jgi:hypothetical protein
MPVDECKKIAKLFATARCHPKDKTGILMGPRVYPWGSIGRRYAQREKVSGKYVRNSMQLTNITDKTYIFIRKWLL